MAGPGLFVPQAAEGSEKAWPRQDPELAAAVGGTAMRCPPVGKFCGRGSRVTGSAYLLLVTLEMEAWLKSLRRSTDEIFQPHVRIRKC